MKINTDMNSIIKKIVNFLPISLKRSLKSRIVLLILKLINTRILSFSQAGEDYNIRNIFKEKKNGFYVDVGAYHPFLVSNTNYFYQFENWRGINIDARPGSMLLFKKFRPRDINLEIGISSNKGELTYFMIDETSPMNTFSKESLIENNLFHLVKKEINLPVLSLTEILDKYLPAGQEIDFLNIDVEGMELDVLRSNNWEKYRPKLIITESGSLLINEVSLTEVSQYLKNKGYEPRVITYLSQDLRNIIYFDESCNFE